MRIAIASCFAILALSSNQVLAFDIGSVLSTVTQAVDTVKSVSGVVSNPTGDQTNTPRLRLTQPSPVGSPLPAKLEESDHVYKELDEMTVFLSRPNLNQDGSIRVEKSELMRGQVYKDAYEHPATQSTMQVWAAYKNQLGQQGYQLDFVCDKPCSNNTDVWEKALGLIIYQKTDRYLVAHKANTWVSVAVGEISDHPRSSVNVVIRNN
ncbi:hypothetical protein C2134_09395 [Chromobacterium sinusclupearum]|uniref:Uncharacterized protein n=1 Tax=Chromobacterium sinusclupearum TaxID=2077146 RepID=A0A2K4MP53_9NEIS|nr:MULTISPECIES: hypothetical protein [Chromobacterium]POA98871.1 hypothetical protein C2134_09395 [Chromobacterium sinusclupearum]